MRLEQNQFVPFMLVMAVITAIVIVISSFNFNHKRNTRFKANLATSDSLHIMPLRVVGANDSVTVTAFKDEPVLLVFWASWSDKSTSMLNEIEQYRDENPSLQVLAALVKDAEESLLEERRYPEFTYLDGAHLFNHLKVPGFPSYILFDENKDILHAQIGYQEGVGYDSLYVYLE